MMEPMLSKAIAQCIFDRGRCWHSRHAPEEDLDPRNIFRSLEVSDSWPQVLAEEVAERRVLRAANGREYPFTFLPIRSFALRYWVVQVLAKRLQGLWTARLNHEYLVSAGRHSLFCGRTGGNSLKYRAWMDAQSSRYYLKVDISSFYPSIHHEKLCEILNTGIDAKHQPLENKALALLPPLLRYRFVEEGNPAIRLCDKGLPIGNTTERFFSNVYLESIDRYLIAQKDISSCRKIDDIRIYSDHRERLEEILGEVKELAAALHLEVNPHKTRISRRISLR